MSTEIRRAQDYRGPNPSTATLYVFSSDTRVDVGINPGGDEDRQISAALDRADFLAAVESELNVRLVPADAIVIERSELPAVEPDDEDEVYLLGGAKYAVGQFRLDFNEPCMLALNLLAIAEYLSANPPIDEAQVTALEAAMCAFADLARKMVAAGVRVEATS